MLRSVSTSSSPVSAAPIPVREARGTGSSLSAGAQASAVVEVSAAEPVALIRAQALRYNSTEFVYRQDIGRIILIGQSPETGERTIQIPSEEALRAYERTIRAEERQTLLASVSQPQSQPQVPLTAATLTPAAPPPQSAPLPSLPQALTAVFGANQSSAVVSISA